MKEYIEKADAINLLWLFADESCASVVSDFEGLPAADVAEVVRCRECKYWIGEHVCDLDCNHETHTGSDDFCSRGQRKEADHD